MVAPVVGPGVSVLAKVLKEVIKKGKSVSPHGNVLTGVLAYDYVSGLFGGDGPFSRTDEQTADGLIKSSMAIIDGAEQGGIPIDGLKGRNGEPLPTNYIVIDVEKERIFPIFKYRSGKTVRAARRRGSSRGWGRAQRSLSQRKYIYR
jgi:hypothetical protein